MQRRTRKLRQKDRRQASQSRQSAAIARRGERSLHPGFQVFPKRNNERNPEIPKPTSTTVESTNPYSLVKRRLGTSNVGAGVDLVDYVEKSNLLRRGDVLASAT